MSKKFYLVTGGTGFIGSAFVKRMLSDGYRIRVLDNQSRGSAGRLEDVANDIEIVEADIRDKDAVEKAVKGVEGVCHLAFVNGTEFFYSKPDLVLDVGVKGMVNVVDACIKHGVKELVLASSSEVYQMPPKVPTDETAPMVIPDLLNPRYSYAAGKMISEMMAVNYGRTSFDRVLIFRPHNVYGPDMGWEHVIPQFVVRMKKLVSESNDTISFPIQGTGAETRAFVFIDDFIDGVIKVIERGEHLGVYHIGTMEEVKISTVAEMIAGYFNRKIEIVPGKLAPGGTPRRCPDISKLKGLGYEPKVSLEKGVKITAKWYKENFSV